MQYILERISAARAAGNRLVYLNRYELPAYTNADSIIQSLVGLGYSAVPANGKHIKVIIYI